jgi:hypothetical protein
LWILKEETKSKTTRQKNGFIQTYNKSFVSMDGRENPSQGDGMIYWFQIDFLKLVWA